MVLCYLVLLVAGGVFFSQGPSGDRSVVELGVRIRNRFRVKSECDEAAGKELDDNLQTVDDLTGRSGWDPGEERIEGMSKAYLQNARRDSLKLSPLEPFQAAETANLPPAAMPFGQI